ncbi:MAG: hypothetical protein RR368_00930 [Oscillospiraceae bacterium]
MKYSGDAMHNIRRLSSKKHKIGFFFSLLYSCLIASIALALYYGLPLLAGNVRAAISPQLTSTFFGALYFYDIAALLSIIFFSFIMPSLYFYDGLTTNKWHMLRKFDISSPLMGLNKLIFGIFSIMRIYVLGFALVCGIQVLSRSAFDLAAALKLLAVGALALVFFVSIAMGFASFASSRGLLRFVILLESVLLLFYLYIMNFFYLSDISFIQRSVHLMLELKLTGIVIIPIAVFALFAMISAFASGSRANKYQLEALNDDMLIKLGVTRSLCVLEKDKDGLSTVFDGADVDYGTPVQDESRLFTYNEPVSHHSSSGKSFAMAVLILLLIFFCAGTAFSAMAQSVINSGSVTIFSMRIEYMEAESVAVGYGAGDVLFLAPTPSNAVFDADEIVVYDDKLACVSSLVANDKAKLLFEDGSLLEVDTSGITHRKIKNDSVLQPLLGFVSSLRGLIVLCVSDLLVLATLIVVGKSGKNKKTRAL